MRILSGTLGCALAIGLLAAVTGVAASGAACFDDIEQHYEEDDAGFMWRSMPDRCPGSPQPASPAERKRGSSVQILASGQDAIVIEKNYWWAPPRNGPDGGCPRPLEMTTKAPDGQVLSQGRTTLLRVGGRGQVVSPDAIKAP